MMDEKKYADAVRRLIPRIPTLPTYKVHTYPMVDALFAHAMGAPMDILVSHERTKKYIRIYAAAYHVIYHPRYQWLRTIKLGDTKICERHIYHSEIFRSAAEEKRFLHICLKISPVMCQAAVTELGDFMSAAYWDALWSLNKEMDFSPETIDIKYPNAPLVYSILAKKLKRFVQKTGMPPTADVRARYM